MKLTKSQKIWLGVLGVGVSALVVDQVIGQDTSLIANAVASVATLSADPAAVPAPRTDPAAVDPTLAFAARLQALGGSADLFDSVRDAFAAPATERTHEGAVGAAALAVTAEQAAQFSARHALRGIVHTGGKSQAWVDGLIIEVGQTLDGARLVSADGMTAVFDLRGTKVTLSLPDARPGSMSDRASKPE